MLFRLVAITSLIAASPVAAWTNAPHASSATRSTTTTQLFHAPAPKHDVGDNPMADLSPEQIARAQAYMEHQQNVPKPGFPIDVRSLVQYNHGFAVMSTNSKS
jgi:hypothetical protein